MPNLIDIIYFGTL